MKTWLQSMIWPVSPTQQQSPILTATKEHNNRSPEMAIHKRSTDLSQWNTDEDDSQEEISQEENNTTEDTHVQIKMDYQKTMIIVVAIFGSVTLVGQFLAHYIVLLFGFLIPAYNTFKAINKFQVVRSMGDVLDRVRHDLQSIQPHGSPVFLVSNVPTVQVPACLLAGERHSKRFEHCVPKIFTQYTRKE